MDRSEQTKKNQAINLYTWGLELLSDGGHVRDADKVGWMLIENAATQGDRDAQNYLGDAYFYSYKKDEKAAFWYTKAAEQGLPEAQAMLGRTPRNIHAYHPLRNGVIADYDATEYMLRYFIRKAIGKALIFKPRVVICVPSSVTNVERRAVIEAAMQAGARKTTVMEEPLAAAIGAGLDIATSNGSMVVDMGGGTTDVAVLSLSGVVISESLRIGSNTFDEAIIRYLEKIKHVAIGQHTAEELKILIGTAMGDGRRMTADVRGRSTETGLPTSVDIDSQEIRQALDEPIQTVLKTIVSILEKTPPELAADIADHGIVLTGGGLLLDSFDRLISQTTGMAAYLCDEPLLCVANGAGKALREMDRLKDSFDDL